jgi:hypothetical protein
MKTELVKLSQIKTNTSNPRQIRDEKFVKLINSILVFPKMLEIRPIVVDDTFVSLGGNMRHRALSSIAGMLIDAVVKRLNETRDYHKKTEAEKNSLIEYWKQWLEKPADTIIKASELSEQEKREFIIKDNAGFGEWDFDALANEWEPEDLKHWCIDIPDIDADFKKQFDEERTENQSEKDDFFNSMLTDCIYESNNELEIPNLLIEKQAGKLELPFSPWGADTRLKKDIATYHFYVEDYRFEAIWKNPDKVLASGVKSIVEPNLSLFDTTPIAYGLHQIYKKRWISRYFQEYGILVYADLNVSKKFKEYNKMGIPKGYNAFFTRGYSDRLEYLKKEFDIAKEISGLQTPNFLVYGGGKNVQKFCIKNSLVYVEQFMNNKK